MRGPGSFLRSTTGTSVVELAFALPVLLILILSGVEITRYVLLNQKIERTAMTVADLVSQAEILSAAALDDLFTAGEFVMEPFDVQVSGRIVVSSLEGGTGGAKVDWQDSTGGGGGGSMFGTSGGAAALPSGFSIDDGETVIAAEVFFDYTPMFDATGIIKSLVGATQVHNYAIFKPRFTTRVIYNP